MELNRLENSRKRLTEKINEGKKYLERERQTFDVNQLSRLRGNLEKKKMQFEKNLRDYEKTEDKDQERINEFENLLGDAEEVYDFQKLLTAEQIDIDKIQNDQLSFTEFDVVFNEK